MSVIGIKECEISKMPVRVGNEPKKRNKKQI
jgi:hypothetical protein